METFQPESFGWKLQRPLEESPTFEVEEDERELGNVTSLLVAEKPTRQWSLRYRVVGRSARDYWVSFFDQLGGPAARFTFTLPEFVPAPFRGPDLTLKATGVQLIRFIRVRFAWRNSSGTTTASPSETIVVIPNNVVVATLPRYPPGVTQAVIYAAESQFESLIGTEQEQVVLTNKRTWESPNGSVLVDTTDPLTESTALQTITAKAANNPPYTIRRLEGLSYEAQIVIEESH